MIRNQKKILAILRAFAKNVMKIFTPRRQLPKLLLLNFLINFLTERTSPNEQLNEAKISLDEIIKSINFKTNKSPSRDGLTAQLYKHFSSKVDLALLDVYDSSGKPGTWCVTYRTGIISVIYKKGDTKDVANFRSIFYIS